MFCIYQRRSEYATCCVGTYCPLRFRPPHFIRWPKSLYCSRIALKESSSVRPNHHWCLAQCPTPYIWIPGRSDGLSGVALESCSCSPTPVLSLRGVEGNGADVVSEVVPTKHQASGLGAALMSSPEWIAGWWRWPVPSTPPHSAFPALIGGRRKRDFRFTGNNALVKKEKKNSISASSECEPLHPNYNFQLRSEDYISQYVLRPRTRTCVKWEVSGVLFGRHAKNLLFFT